MPILLALLGAVGLLLGTIGPVAADPPHKEAWRTFSIDCYVATSLGIATLYADDNGNVGVDIWSGEPGESDVVVTLDGNWPADVAIDLKSGDVSMILPVLPDGEVTVTGSLTRSEHNVYDENFHIPGNTSASLHVRRTGYDFAGSMSLPGVASPVALGPGDCSSSDIEYTSFVSDPNSNRTSWWLDLAEEISYTASTYGSCRVTNAEGDIAEISFQVGDSPYPDAGDRYLVLDVTVTDTDGGSFQGSGYAYSRADGSFANDVVEDYTEDVSGTFVLTIVDTGQRFEYTLWSNTSKERVQGKLFDVEGDLITTAGSFSLAPCVGVEQALKGIFTDPKGPKPGGNQPENDLPSGAIAVGAGYRATLATRGADEVGEADAPCLPYPIAYSVWYRVAGTGVPVTVDTAASDFDTALAIYTGTPEASPSTYCVDDVPLQPFGRTLQAAATFDTTVGTTYWVQVGGLAQVANAYGALKLAVR
jgi:hypothetical protein